jgi:hypothetical protein
MKLFLAQPRYALLLLLALAALGLTACASTESENASSRPWDQPYGWENGLGGMNQYNR